MHHNQIIAVLREHGFAEGRLIANSKSGYCKWHRSHFVVFNAQVCSLGGRVLKQADLDLDLDAEKLTAAARAVGENLFVLFENQPSPFWESGSIPMSRVLRDGRRRPSGCIVRTRASISSARMAHAFYPRSAIWTTLAIRTTCAKWESSRTR